MNVIQTDTNQGDLMQENCMYDFPSCLWPSPSFIGTLQPIRIMCKLLDDLDDLLAYANSILIFFKIAFLPIVIVKESGT